MVVQHRQRQRYLQLRLRASAMIGLQWLQNRVVGIGIDSRNGQYRRRDLVGSTVHNFVYNREKPAEEVARSKAEGEVSITVPL